MTRTRSEYRLSPIRVDPSTVPMTVAQPLDEHRDPLAVLMLEAYRDTIDDEGETITDARRAVDHYLGSILRRHSFVAFDGADPIAFAFVLVVDDVHYVDPVVVAPTHQRRGVGAAVVRRCLESLAEVGVSEVGATITDGNVASERLFAGLGFSRRGPWG